MAGLFLLTLLSHAADGATLTWLGDVNANWNGGTSGSNTNWISNTLPVNGDSLIFDLTQVGVANLSNMNDLTGLTLGGTNAISLTNDGGTDTGFTLTGNAVTLGGNITSSGTTGTHTHTLSLGLILSGTRTLTAVTGTTIVIDGTISESGGSFGFLKSGAGAATLTGNNSFTGAVSVNQGTLSASSIADSGINSAIGAGSVINIGSGTNTAGTFTYTGAGGSTNRTINLAATTTGGAVINSSGTGALVFTGAFNNAGSGAKTLTLGGSNANNNEIQSVISNGSGTLTVTKTNAGTWVLSNANNSFTGAVSINQGMLAVNSIAAGGTNSALGAGTVINFGSGGQTGTLLYTGAAATSNRTLNLASAGAGGAVIESSGTGALTLTGNLTNAATSGTKTLTLSGTALNNDIQGLISNGGTAVVAVSKDNSTGSWILSNNDNSFTGALSIGRGTVTVTSIANGNVNSAAGAGTVINLGTGAQTGVLNYTGGGNTTDRAINLVVAGNTGAGTLNNNGANGGTGLIFTGVFTNSGTTGTKTFTLGGANTDANDFQSLISNGTGGGVIALTKANAGTWTLSNASNSFSGAVSINQGTLAVNSIASGGTNSALGAGSVINFGSGTSTGTLFYTGGGATVNRDINLVVAANTGSGTISNNGTGALVFNGTFTNSGTSGTKTFTLNGTYVGANEFQSQVSNGVGGGAIALAKSGDGIWALTAANTYSGGTTLSAGTLRINNGGAGGTSSAIGTGTLTITGGIIDNTSGFAKTLSTNNAVAFNGDFAFEGTNDLNLGSGIVTMANANRAIMLNGSSTLTLGELQWNSAANSRTLTLNQGSGSGAKILLGGFQLNINADTAARNRIITGSANIEILGVVSNGNGFNNGFIYSGSSLLTLSAANTYTGTTTVNAGTLKIGNAGALTNSSSLAINAGVVDVNGFNASSAGALTLGAATTTTGGLTAGLIDTAGGGGYALNGDITYNAGSVGFINGQATISANLVLSADRTLTVNDSSAAAVDLHISGVISGGVSVTKGNGGTLRLSGTNTFTGQAFLNNGITQVTSIGNIGTAGSLGTGDKDAPAGIIRLGFQTSNGTLEYTGPGESTNRRIQVGSGANVAHTGGATIVNNGTGALIFTAANFNNPVNTGAGTASTGRVITLGGSNTGANTIQGIIANNLQTFNATVSVVKQDSGTWMLQGVNTYSGSTTVQAGTLTIGVGGDGTSAAQAASKGRTGGGLTTVNASATLTGTGLIQGGLALNGGTLRPGDTAGNSVGTLWVGGDATFTSGSIALQITSASQHDILKVGGTFDWAAGAGIVSILNNGYTPTAGDVFDLLDWAQILNTENVNVGTGLELFNLGSGFLWDTSLWASHGQLVVSIPEPSRAILSLLGMTFITLRRRRTF